MEWACEAGEAKQLSSDARTVLVAVAYFAHPRDGMAWNATRAEIRAKTALSVVRIIRAVHEIEEARVIPMARLRRGIAWGPFPVLPRGGVDNRRVPRGHGRAPQRITATVWRADSTRASRLVMCSRNHQEGENLRGEDCDLCGGIGRVIDSKTERSIPCPTCRA